LIIDIIQLHRKLTHALLLLDQFTGEEVSPRMELIDGALGAISFLIFHDDDDNKQDQRFQRDPVLKKRAKIQGLA